MSKFIQEDLWKSRRISHRRGFCLSIHTLLLFVFYFTFFFFVVVLSIAQFEHASASEEFFFVLIGIMGNRRTSLERGNQ